MGPRSDPTHHQEAKREVIEFVKMVLWFLVIFIVLRTYVIEGYEVQGPSMEPTLVNGERILVFKLNHILSQYRTFSKLEPIRSGDIVVFEGPDDASKQYVKRIVASGPRRPRGNTVVAEGQDSGLSQSEPVDVEIADGNLYVNHHRVTENYLPEGVDPTIDSPDDTALGVGEYYVLGDNRTRSKDSRIFGPVKEDKIVGEAVLRFWPLHRLGLLR
jgi:signal peptidase I